MKSFLWMFSFLAVRQNADIIFFALTELAQGRIPKLEDKNITVELEVYDGCPKKLLLNL